MRGAAAVLLFILMGISGRALAAELRGVVAVLPFNFNDAQLEKASRTARVESVATVTADKLGAAGYTVLSGENTLAILQENGVDPATACDTNCSLSAARELKASLFLSVTVTTVEKTHIVFIRLFESAKGAQLSSVELQASNVLGLNQQVKAHADELFGPLLRQAGKKNGPRTTLGKFESTPAGAVVSVDGELVCESTPCAQEVVVGQHRILIQKQRHATFQQDVSVERGTVVRAVLAPLFATVTVETTPAGLPLALDEQPPAVVSRPLELDAGIHQLVVDAPCWMRTIEKFEVAAGEKPTITVSPRPRSADLVVTSTDAESKDIVATVMVDGTTIGKTPGQYSASICAHELELVGPDGARWKTSLSLTEDEVLRVRGILSAATAIPMTTQRKVGLAMTAVGLVTVAVGVGLGIAARTQAADLRTTPHPGTEVNAAVDSANRKALVANVLLGAGGLLGATGIGLAVAF